MFACEDEGQRNVRRLRGKIVLDAVLNKKGMT